MKIKIPKSLYFETDRGKKIYINDEDLKNINIPSIASYQISQFPCQLVTNYLKLKRNGSELIATTTSTWPPDLVLAMTNSGDYSLPDSILICANTCERCLNSLAFKYHLKWGYSEYSEEWKKSKASCEFCYSYIETFYKKIKQLCNILTNG